MVISGEFIVTGAEEFLAAKAIEDYATGNNKWCHCVSSGLKQELKWSLFYYYLFLY